LIFLSSKDVNYFKIYITYASFRDFAYEI